MFDADTSSPPTPGELLMRVWPYLAAVARRAAPRLRMEPRDLLHDFAVHTLTHADEWKPGDATPTKFAFYWCKRVIYEHRRRRRVAARYQRHLLNQHPRNDSPPRPDVMETDDPADLAERSDAAARLAVGVELLSPKRREAIEARYGLSGKEPVVGAELGKLLGVRAQTTNERIIGALRDLATFFGEDTAKVKVDRSEGIRMARERERREAGQYN